MRVLHIGKYYPPHRGGIETHVESLSRELTRSVDLRVVVANSSRRSLSEQIDGVSVRRIGMPFQVAGAPVCPGMIRAIREWPADIVHIHWPNPTAVLAYLLSGRRTRLVFSYHSDVVRQRLLGKAFHPILELTLASCAAVIVSSPAYAASSPVLCRFGELCHVIPYGIPLEPYGRCDPLAVERIRTKYGPRIVLSVGRQVYYKGFEYLVSAMQRVDGRALLVGDGPLRPKLEELTRTLGLGNRVTFLGEVDDLVPFYHAADIFVLPSVERSEAFGIVQLEAMACGKPVVNTALESGVPFVSRDRETGLTVPPRNAGAMTDAINLLLHEDRLRTSYGKAARSRVEQKFCIQEMVQQTLAVYEKVAHQPAANGRALSLAARPWR